MISRILLTVATLLFWGALVSLMVKGWRNRQARQSDLPAPAVATGPVDPGAPRVPGLFIGTTGSAHWLDRIAVHHLSDRSRCDLAIGIDGVHLEREGLAELYLPFAAIEAVSIEKALAGKVVSAGLLVLTWRLGDHTLTSAFRADDPADHAPLRDAITALLPEGSTALLPRDVVDRPHPDRVVPPHGSTAPLEAHR